MVDFPANVLLIVQIGKSAGTLEKINERPHPQHYSDGTKGTEAALLKQLGLY